jgi:hypothetical protein
MSGIAVVNPERRDYCRHKYILHFGAYGWTMVMVWANSLDSALDEAVDWLAENGPGLICDDAVAEAYREAIAEGLSEEDAYTRACEDTTSAGNEGHYILSYEWGVSAEDPTREQVLELGERYGFTYNGKQSRPGTHG